MDQEEYTTKFNFIVEFIKSRDTKNMTITADEDYASESLSDTYDEYVKKSARPLKTKSIYHKSTIIEQFFNDTQINDVIKPEQKMFTCKVDTDTTAVYKKEFPMGKTIIIGKLEFYNDMPKNRLRQELFQTCYDYVKSVDIAQYLFEF